MVSYTPNHGLPYPTTADTVVPAARDFVDLAQSADSALTSVLGQAIEAWATKTAVTGQDANTLTDEGTYGSVSGATIANRPADAGQSGILTTRRLSTAGGAPRIQTFLSYGGNSGTWSRFQASGNWSTWTRIDGANALRDHGFIGATSDLNNTTDPGVYGYWQSTQNNPSGRSGVVWVAHVNNTTNLVQLAIDYGLNPALYTRFRAAEWSGWTRLDTGGLPSGGGTEASPTALKTAPVALSASTATAEVAAGPQSLRFPFRVNAPITRWRLHVANYNDRTATPYATGAHISGVWVGERSSSDAGFASAPSQVSGPFTVASNGEEYVTPWTNAPLGDGQDMLISLGLTTSAAEGRIWTFSPAGVYRHTDPGAASATSGDGFTRETYTPLSWWVEVETYATTGQAEDSIITGTGNDLILHDSLLSQYCRRIGAIPVHYSYPGTGMVVWTNANTHQWTRWSDLSRVDAVIHFMGQNDLHPDQTLAGMQERFNDTIEHLKSHVSKNVYLATLTPHSGKSATINTVRKNYNAWLKTLPGGARDCFDFSAAVANATDDAILPQYTSDTLHLSTAGSTQVATTITRPVTTERTDRDTGVLDITAQAANVASGTVTFQHKNGWNTITFGNLSPSATGSVAIFPNNAPTLAPWAPPDAPRSEALALGSNGTDYRRANLTTVGGLTLYGVTAGDVVNGSITWPMNRPMP